MTKSTNARVDKEVLEKIFYTYGPVMEAAIEQNAIPIQTVEALCGNFLDLLKRKDPLSKQIVEFTFDYLASLHDE